MNNPYFYHFCFLLIPLYLLFYHFYEKRLTEKTSHIEEIETIEKYYIPSIYRRKFKTSQKITLRNWILEKYEKVKHETLDMYKHNKKNIHYRKYIQLNRWWWNEL